jgi:hypothetical protein
MLKELNITVVVFAVFMFPKNKGNLQDYVVEDSLFIMLQL